MIQHNSELNKVLMEKASLFNHSKVELLCSNVMNLRKDFNKSEELVSGYR